MLLKIFSIIFCLLALVSTCTNAQGLVMEEPVYVENSHIVIYKENLLNLTVDFVTDLLVNLVNSLNLGGITITNRYNNVITGIAINILNPVNEIPILEAIRGFLYVDCTVKNQKFHILQGEVELLEERYNNPVLRRLLELRRRDNDNRDSDNNRFTSNSRRSYSYNPSAPSSGGFTTIASGETKPVNLRRVGFTGTNNNQISEPLSGVNIALLDTGIDFNHPDLKDSVVNGINCVTRNSPAADDHGHGTNIAGIITANNAGQGIVGAIPGTKVYSVKIADATGYASLSAELCGLDWVAQNAGQYNIKVASMSIGGPGTTDNQCGRSTCDALHRAVCNLTTRSNNPVSLVTSAGNSGTSIEGTIPAAYSEVLTVTSYSDSDGLKGGFGATLCNGNNDDSIATYSNYAPNSMQDHVIMAPGSCIYTTALQSATSTNSLYKYATGTSFSTPHVTAALALCYSDQRTNVGCSNLNAIDAQQKLIANSLAYNQANPDYAANNGPAMPTGAYYGPLLYVDTQY